MGGVVGTLLYLFCRSGCQASVVASALAFHPPDPLYTLTYDENTKEYKVCFTEGQPDLATLRMKGDMVEVARGMKIPVLVVTHPNAKYTMIYSHGNATDCGAMFPMYCMIALYLKINVVGYDYTGYGASMAAGIPPTEKQTYKDIKAVYDYCLRTKLVSDPSSEIVLYGQSVGSGPSCYLAGCSKTRPIAGLVLHSPILSGLRVITDSRFLACFDIFPNIKRIRNIKVPLFVIHGKDDLEVTFKHGTGLWEAAPAALRYDPWWVPQRGHNNVLERNEPEFIRRMSMYLDHLVAFHKERVAKATVSGTGEGKKTDAGQGWGCLGGAKNRTEQPNTSTESNIYAANMQVTTV